MKDNKNSKWTKEDIALQYKRENPDWNWKYCLKKAEEIHKELNRLNEKLWRDNELFFKMNEPFSSYEYKDSEFASIFFDKREMDEI